VRVVGSATYLHERARQRLSRGAALIVGGLLLLGWGVAGAGQSSYGSASTFFGLGGAVIGMFQVNAARRDSRAGGGEGTVLAQLSARFDDTYSYYRRVRVPGHTAEADGVLIGPHGALVLANVLAEGTFEVEGHDWFEVDADGARQPWERSPTWELVRPMRTIERAIREAGLGDVPVQGAVVLVQGTLARADRPAQAVVPVSQISAYVSYLRQGEGLSPDTRARLADLLEGFVAASPAQAPAREAGDIRPR
jgi:hypothetical protein